MLLILHISASVCPKKPPLELSPAPGDLWVFTPGVHQRVYTRSHMIIGRQAVVSGWTSAVVYHGATLARTDVDVAALSAGLGRTPGELWTVDLVNDVPILSFFAGQLGR